MLARKPTKSLGSIPQHKIRPNKEVEEVLFFLEKILTIFQKEFMNRSEQSEPVLNEKLELWLQSYARQSDKPFLFKGEKLNEDNPQRKVDIGVMLFQNDYVEERAFFSIECKRLPTPGYEREREYVCGNLGGIERFKKGLHGKSSLQNAMIAYVQRESFQYWYQSINQWIEELTNSESNNTILWNNNDKLKNICNYQIPEISKFISLNDRKCFNDVIEIHHFWIKLK